MKKYFFVFFLAFLSSITYCQTYLNWDSYSVEEFYEKIDLDAGTLDEDGNSISYIYVVTEIKDGVYEIEVSDGDGDLYEIKGTDFHISFRLYYGYAGYGEEGVLVIGKSAWSGTFYKNPE